MVLLIFYTIRQLYTHIQFYFNDKRIVSYLDAYYTVETLKSLAYKSLSYIYVVMTEIHETQRK